MTIPSLTSLIKSTNHAKFSSAASATTIIKPKTFSASFLQLTEGYNSGEIADIPSLTSQLALLIDHHFVLISSKHKQELLASTQQLLGIDQQLIDLPTHIFDEVNN